MDDGSLNKLWLSRTSSIALLRVPIRKDLPIFHKVQRIGEHVACNSSAPDTRNKFLLPGVHGTV
ncbi:Hypothetical protein Cp1002B_0442 [Corynebacterium pseudotuberculosis]|nr:Hypothetical protein CpPAT10_0424a [Corynebacterium pseudotuberculosis PAT10]AFF21577.1 Hypothetical protein CpP54B96_0425 [Corynebacterium pseudotuberculosis P54B96]AFH51344.1 Hypothetical protein Cp267_0437 [Corynebacterium pseudotuberculosis 267]AJC13157.1 Hypothetical protein CpVD57_0429 [Corynebacterium pseudotuberculosis]AKJ55091.1 Hypothetical protein Cp12C_0447 [Corynebacterium pseudotuberculosis]